VTTILPHSKSDVFRLSRSHRFLPLFVGLLSVLSVRAADAQRLILSTRSGSSLDYYYEGWRQVMYEGDYSASEAAYREAVRRDPHFLMAQSLLARISGDLDERQRLQKEIEQRKDQVHGDERRLLDSYLALVNLMNVRETHPDRADSVARQALVDSEPVLRTIAHRYPDEEYYRAEYVEVLNYVHGPQTALDSIAVFTTRGGESNVFLRGYKAELLADSGRLDEAFTEASDFSELFSDRDVPRPHVVLAYVLLKMAKPERARPHVLRALELDPKNIDAQRLKNRLDSFVH